MPFALPGAVMPKHNGQQSWGYAPNPNVGPVAPTGFGFFRVGSALVSSYVRVGSDSASPYILIPNGA